MKALVYLCLLALQPAWAQSSDLPLELENTTAPAHCPSEAGPKDCRGLPVGSDCEARGLMGAKMPGECQYMPEYERCGCYPIFR